MHRYKYVHRIELEVDDSRCGGRDALYDDVVMYGFA